MKRLGANGTSLSTSQLGLLGVPAEKKTQRLDDGCSATIIIFPPGGSKIVHCIKNLKKESIGNFIVVKSSKKSAAFRRGELGTERTVAESLAQHAFGETGSGGPGTSSKSTKTEPAGIVLVVAKMRNGCNNSQC